MMSEEVGYLKEKLENINQKRAILVGFILLFFLVVLGYFGFCRPIIVVVPGHPGIYVKNEGNMDALIVRVDGFWYWAGQVAMLDNMPDIHQLVEPGVVQVRLQLPDIPLPAKKITQENGCYMKLAVRYRIPGNPIFRYITMSYFRYDQNRKVWAAIKSIPVKYRSLGNVATGNVGRIELDFH
ncbi:MAG: hypothetical protein HWN68_17440 [Desulfobacterales bacterium]|nr:hypothetical protein [Desulfobacterales bacterium]